MGIDLAPNNPYGLTLATPVLAAAGCMGYGVEYERLADLSRLGALVTRSTSLRPRRVARPPRLIETPAGVLSVGGWPNPGLRAVVERYAPAWESWDLPIILSVVGADPAELVELVELLEGVQGIAGLELNLLESPRPAASVAAVRAATGLPLLAKLPPLDDEPLAELARAAGAAGADALTVGGPVRGGHADEGSGELLEGWLSGPALRPLALWRVAMVVAAADVPVLAGGGAATPTDGRAFLAAGARAVQVGAALLADPNAAGRIGDALRG